MNLRDSLPVFAPRSGAISYDPNHPDNVAARLRREAQEREVRGKWQPVYDRLVAAAGDGLVGRLVALHRPLLGPGDDPPDCAYCGDENDYGGRVGVWPCAETRVIAAELGVEMPPREDDD